MQLRFFSFKWPHGRYLFSQIKPKNIPLEGQLTLDIPGIGLNNERDAYKTAEITVGGTPCTNITATGSNL